MMTPEERITRQKALIEQMGRIFEKQGFGLITGRIMGLLMVMDKEEYTFDEIVEELKISKSTASHALRILEARDLIEYKTQAGARKRFFQLRRFDSSALIDDYHNKLKESCNYMKAVLDLKADPESPNALFLRDIVQMTNFFLDKFDELKAEYFSRS